MGDGTVDIISEKSITFTYVKWCPSLMAVVMMTVIATWSTVGLTRTGIGRGKEFFQHFYILYYGKRVASFLDPKPKLIETEDRTLRSAKYSQGLRYQISTDAVTEQNQGEQFRIFSMREMIMLFSTS